MRKNLLKVGVATVLIFLFIVTTTVVAQTNTGGSPPTASANVTPRNVLPPRTPPTSTTPPDTADAPSITRNTPKSLDEAERDELRKYRLERELQEDFMKWAAWHFVIFTLILSAISLFGLRSFVREMIQTEMRDAMRATAKAQAAADLTAEATKSARVAAEDAKALIDDLTRSADRIEKRFSELEAQIETEGSHTLRAASLQMDELSRRMDELSETVKRVARETPSGSAEVERLEDRVAQIGTAAAATRADFEKNSQYRVVVTSHGDFDETKDVTQELINRLTERGFRAIDGRWSGAVARKFDSVQVHYKPELHDVATDVSGLVLEVLDAHDSKKPIEATGRDMTPLGGYDIAIFVGG